MKYVEREYHIEYHPENESDMKCLRDNYDAKGIFQFWCVARKPSDMPAPKFPTHKPTE